MHISMLAFRRPEEVAEKRSCNAQRLLECEGCIRASFTDRRDTTCAAQATAFIHTHTEAERSEPSQSSRVSSCSSVAYVNMIRLDYGNVQRDLVGVGRCFAAPVSGNS